MSRLACRPVRAITHAPSVASVELARLAIRSLWDELALHPKPGLVSLRDNGAHEDMSAATFIRSLFALRRYFRDIADAGAAAATATSLRALGVVAEARMMAATRGINTHRGAIFVLGWLVATCACTLAAGQYPCDETIRRTFARTWGRALSSWPRSPSSHGAQVEALHGARGAWGEATDAFPSVFTIGLPALREARERTNDPRLAHLACFFALLERVDDTNVLYRGGLEGLRFAQQGAARVREMGGVMTQAGMAYAQSLHQAFVKRRLSPGGCADLLSATLFVDTVQRAAK